MVKSKALGRGHPVKSTKSLKPAKLIKTFANPSDLADYACIMNAIMAN